jgi:glutaredoxin
MPVRDFFEQFGTGRDRVKKRDGRQRDRLLSARELSNGREKKSNQRHPSETKRDHMPAAKNLRSVVLYTRRGCHLCDVAKQLLESHGLTPSCIDVDADPALTARFGECVPVVEIDGRIRFRGRVEPVLLRRLLERGA